MGSDPRPPIIMGEAGGIPAQLVDLARGGEREKTTVSLGLAELAIIEAWDQGATNQEWPRGTDDNAKCAPNPYRYPTDRLALVAKVGGRLVPADRKPQRGESLDHVASLAGLVERLAEHLDRLAGLVEAHIRGEDDRG